MRIIAGRYRRRTLLTNPGLTTRPITDRVKESMFEHLNPWLQGAKIADVFAGTGTMGFMLASKSTRFSAVKFSLSHCTDTTALRMWALLITDLS